MNDMKTTSLLYLPSQTELKPLMQNVQYHGGNKTQSKVILLALSVILHGSVLSQKTNSRIS